MDNSITHYLLCLLVQVKNGGKKAYVGVLTLWTVGIKYEQSSMQTFFQWFFPFSFFFAGKDKTVRYKWKLNV